MAGNVQFSGDKMIVFHVNEFKLNVMSLSSCQLADLEANARLIVQTFH